VSQLERQHARVEALRKLHELEDAILLSAATAKQKAFMRQYLAHLWSFADKAMGGEETRP
jgi:hypothetical protein